MKSLQIKYAIADNILIGCIFGFLLCGFLWLLGGVLFWFKHGYWSQIFTICYFFGMSCAPSTSGWMGYDKIYDFIFLNSSPQGVVAAFSFFLYTPTYLIRRYYGNEVRRLINIQCPQI